MVHLSLSRPNSPPILLVFLAHPTPRVYFCLAPALLSFIRCPFSLIPHTHSQSSTFGLVPILLNLFLPGSTGLNNVRACAGCHDNISKILARKRCVVLLSFTTEWRKWSREFPFIIESNVCISSFYSGKFYF